MIATQVPIYLQAPESDDEADLAPFGPFAALHQACNDNVRAAVAPYLRTLYWLRGQTRMPVAGDFPHIEVRRGKSATICPAGICAYRFLS